MPNKDLLFSYQSKKGARSFLKNRSELRRQRMCGSGPLARNPWNLDHIPGGSSSGSGAAVAAGFCMGSLGSCMDFETDGITEIHDPFGLAERERHACPPTLLALSGHPAWWRNTRRRLLYASTAVTVSGFRFYSQIYGSMAKVTTRPKFARVM